MIGPLLATLAAILALMAIGVAVNARTRGRHRAWIDAPSDRVWDAITDIDVHPRWQPQLDRVRKTGERTWLESRTDGLEQTLEVLEAEPERRVVWRLKESHGAYDATWKIELEPHRGGTRIRARQRDTARSRTLARTVSFLRGGRDVELREFLAQLRIHLQERSWDGCAASPPR